MLDGQAGLVLDSVHEAAAQPARARLGVGRDDDLVRLEDLAGVHRGRVGIRVHHLAGGLDVLVGELGDGELQPVLGRLAHRAVVDHVAVLGLVLGSDHEGLDLALGLAALHGVDQRLAADGLVGYDEDLHSAATGSRFSAGALNTACCAPGTPYSYGPPTTVGISSKLKIGGGEDTCHSIVWARHGLAGAFGPCRHEEIML